MLRYMLATFWAAIFAFYQAIRVAILRGIHGLMGKSFPPSSATNVADKSLRAVLITGTSTGIGYDLMQRLLIRGYTVFGTVRTNEDATRLRNETRAYDGVLNLVVMDVRQIASIEMASRVVLTWLNGNVSRQLVAVVNNAGLAEAMALELESFEAATTIVDVNLVGVMRVSKIFLPYLRESNGRLIVVGSALSSLGIPMLSSYCATKAALETWCDAIRRELAPQNIFVSLIRPGVIDTEAYRKGEQWFLSSVANLTEAQVVIKRRYYQTFFDYFDRYISSMKGRGLSPYYVSLAIVDSIESPIPQTRYIVGIDAWLVTWTARLFPTFLMDLGLRTAISTYALWARIASSRS